MNKYNEFRLDKSNLSWSLDESLPFETTKDIEPSSAIYGHKTAKEALEFAMSSPAEGMNAYVRGINGSGRRTLVSQMIADLKPQARKHEDFCYVHNFPHPNSPKLIILKSGDGKKFKQIMVSFANFVKEELSERLEKSELADKIKSIESTIEKSVDASYEPLEKKLSAVDMMMVQLKHKENDVTAILPVVEGQPVPFENLDELITQNKITKDKKNVWLEQVSEFTEELEKITHAVNKLVRDGIEKVREQEQYFAQSILDKKLKSIKSVFNVGSVNDYLDELSEDFIENVLHEQKQSFDPHLFYGVNVLFTDSTGYSAPTIFERAPSLSGLLGAVEIGEDLLPYQRVNAGSLVNAHGGFFVLEIDEALSENGVWPVIMRVLRTKKLDFSFEDRPNGQPVLITPDAIPLDIKVILVGNHQRYYDLSTHDSHFECYFKILADLDTVLPRKTETYLRYAAIISKVVKKEKLLHFKNCAVKSIIEYGARISHQKDSLSTHFRQVMDVAREASFLAKKSSDEIVKEIHIKSALLAAKKRHFSSANHFYNMLESGIIIINTSGKVTGQINGLAVTRSGQVDYGFPARITATVSPGTQGLINIEDQAKLSGQIHTKGFHILGGLLRHLLRPNHPISFSASIAFEQSYGGIDGDSASGAEACCLLSAICDKPINQGLSMTGAIDQFGHLQAIGGVNEKIEGFFDSCLKQNELTGNQGVIIPASNVADLMLKPEVVAACEKNEFHIYAVSHVLDAFAILTDTDSCKESLLTCNAYPKDSSLDIVTVNLKNLYQQSSMSA